MINKPINGEEALAMAAHDEKVLLATGYPGSPGGGIISMLESAYESIDSHWSANEKIALEKAIGVAINGEKALVCIKSVGLNAMLDPLTVVNMTPLNGALVIVVGDDPGGYGSQNDQDSRTLAQFLNLPWFEPADPDSGYTMMRMAFKLSKNYRLPVFIRITRSFALEKQAVYPTNTSYEIAPYDFADIVEKRFVPTPANAVAKHQELDERMLVFNNNSHLLKLNKVKQSSSSIGIIVCGHLISKVKDVVDLDILAKKAKILLLQSIYPINIIEITKFLTGLEKVLILEENNPVIARQIMAIAAKNQLQIDWQLAHHPGEMFRWEIAQILKNEFAGLAITPSYEHPIDEKPKLKSNCSKSRYNEVLDILDACSVQLDQEFNYYGDPGCLVAVSDRLQGKYAMGGSIATAFGAGKANPTVLNIALIGDSGFFHSALPAICDASSNEVNLPMILLNNKAALTTGGQYHPGINKKDGSQRLDYQAILRSCGVNHYHHVILDEKKEELVEIITAFLKLNVVRFLQIDIP